MRFRSIILLLSALFSNISLAHAVELGGPTTIGGPPKAPPPVRPYKEAFAESDFEPPHAANGYLTGWERYNVLGNGFVDFLRTDSVDCDKMLRPVTELSNNGIPLIDPAIGGDYWRISTPSRRYLGQDGNCWLSADTTDQRWIRSPLINATGYTTVAVYARTYAAGSAPALAVIKLLDENKKELQRVYVNKAEAFSQYTFDVSALPTYINRSKLFLGFVSVSGTSIEIDNVRLWQGQPPPLRAIGKISDTPRPDGVFGFADMHIHPAANLGFGGVSPDHYGNGWNSSLIFGAMDATADELRHCEHGPTDVENGIFTESFEPAGHAGTGYPEFKYWPRFNSVLHQQVHLKWLKRAWQGGLRLAVFHAVNNTLLARSFAYGNTKEMNDMVSARTQLEGMIAAIKESEFMQVATTPNQARQIAEEGKLAVILGVEIDSIGKCHEHNNVLSEEGQPLASPCSWEDVKTDIDELYDELSVRHVFLVHHADNDFGGSALYELSFAKYNAWFRGADWDPIDAKDVDVPFIGVKLTAGWDLVGDFLSGLLGNIGLDEKSWPRGPHVNSRSLADGTDPHFKNDLGKKTLEYMWDRGMMVEIDHMSELMSRKAMELAKNRGVSMVAGHTAPRELQFDNEDAAAHWKMAAENNKSNKQIQDLHALGGVMGIGTGPTDTNPSGYTTVPNTCPGSSASWLQFYAETVHLKSTRATGMPKEFVGVGLGTDMHFQMQLYPRFGVHACIGGSGGLFATEFDHHRPLSLSAVDAQDHAVSYSSAPFTYYTTRFQRPIGDYQPWEVWDPAVPPPAPYLDNYLRYPTEAYGARERAVWQALFIAEAKVDPLTADLSSAWNWWHWVEGAQHFALGFMQDATQSKGDCTDVHPLTGKPLGSFGCGERRTAYLIKAGLTAPSATDHPDVKAAVQRYMPMAIRVYTSFQKMRTGGNREFPLSRATAGSREFDYNVDGLAHYGMIPDFLQDASNQLKARPSSTVKDLSALLHSAEDYIQMWDKTWKQKKP